MHKMQASLRCNKAAKSVFSAALGLLTAASFTQIANAQVPPYGAAAAETSSSVDPMVTTATAPNAYAESSNIIGLGTQIKAVRLPVTNSSGAVGYRDVTINLTVSSSGTISAVSHTDVPSPPLIIGNFRAGNYKDTSGNKYTVAGPGPLPGGRTKWTLAWVPPTAKTGTFNITWATGPVTGHPFEAVLKRYGITASTYSWGLVGEAAAGSGGFPSPPFGSWGTDHAFGAWQTGDQLELHLFAGSTEFQHVFLSRCATTC